MSDVIGSAEFELRATAKKLKADIDRAQRETKQAAERIASDFEASSRRSTAAWNKASTQWARDVRRAEKEIRASAGDMKTALAGAAGALAGAFSVQAAISMADGYQRTTNALKIAGIEGEALTQVLDALYASANKNGAPIEALSTLYSRASQAAGDLGASQADLLRFSDGVATALRIQGVSATEAQGPLLQLSQALSGGIVRAEEFNSISEGLRPILEAAAAGSDRFKGSVTALRLAVMEGTVSSQEFFQIILAGMKVLEDKGAKAPLTVAGAIQTLQNQLQRYVGEAAESHGVTQALALGIKTFAENIPTVANALAVLALVLAGRYTASVVVGTAANVAYTATLIAKTAAIYGVSSAAAAGAVSMRGLSASMAFFGGPIGLAITGVSLAVWALYEANKAATRADKEHAAAAERVRASVEAYGKAADAAAQATGRERKELLEAAKAARISAAADRQATADKLAKARATLAAMRAAAMEKIHSGTLDPEGAGMQIAAMGLTESKLMSNVDLLAKELAKADADIKAIDARIKALGAGDKPPAAPDGTTARTRETVLSAEELKAARERIALEDQLAIAEASGDQARIAALRMQLDLLQLIARYRQAGYSQSDAEQMALDQMRREGQARRESAPPRPVEVDQNPPDFQPTGEYLPGGSVVINGQILSAEDMARAKEQFRETFSSGVIAALRDGEDGLRRWFADNAYQGLERALDRLSDMLFDLFAKAMQNGQGGAGGGGWLATIGSIFTGGGGGPSFGGARAYGGPVQAGQSYLVGERGPERFIPSTGGLIMPTPSLAMAGAGASGPRGEVVVRVQSDDEKFRAFVAGVAGPIAARGDAAVMGAGMADKQRSAQRQQYRARR